MDAAKRVQTQTLRPILVVYIRLVLEHLARKTYHIYMQNYPNSACTKKVFFVHALARQFCMYTKHIWRWKFGFEYTEGGFWRSFTKNIPHLHALGPQFCMYAKHTRPTYTITPILHVRRSLFSYTRQFCMYTSGAGNSVSVSIVRKIRATTRGRSRASTEAGGASQRRLLSTQFLHEDGSGLVSTALDKRVLRLLVQCGGLFFSGPGPYLGLQLVIFMKLFDN